MKPKVLHTESYQIKGKGEAKYFPFYELAYDEWVIYENDIPKYYMELNPENRSQSKLVQGIIEKLKEGTGLREIVMTLGKDLNRKWDILHPEQGNDVPNSHQSAQVELLILDDSIYNE